MACTSPEGLAALETQDLDVQTEYNSALPFAFMIRARS